MRTLGTTVALLVLIVPASLQARPRRRPPPADPAGFVFRAGLGFGYLRDEFIGPFRILDGEASGGTLAFHLHAGWSIAPRWSLGAALLVDSAVDPDVDNHGVDVSGSVEVGALAHFGFAVGFRPAPTGPWELLATVGGARLSITDSDGDVSDHAPTGGALSLSLTHDWRLSRDWTLGLTGRLLGASLEDEDVDHDLFTAALLLTFGFR